MSIGTEESEVRDISADAARMSVGIVGASVKTHSVVSMFSGCGGMDLGFLGGFHFGERYYDRLPFEIAWANDVVSVPACETYEHNLKHQIIRGDVIDALETLPESADVIIGGFPCQDVSINGSRLGTHGKRTILYRQMIEAIRRGETAHIRGGECQGAEAGAWARDVRADDRGIQGHRIRGVSFAISGG